MACSDTLIGFSTGALARGNFRDALAMLSGKDTNAIELSALREAELGPLLTATGGLDLTEYEHVSLHAPSRFEDCPESGIVGSIADAIPDNWYVTAHPDSISDWAAWRRFGNRLCIENMDKRKPIGRTANELRPVFDLLPDASMCLDLAHARQCDPTMSCAAEMIAVWGDRIRQIHISDIDRNGRHLPLSATAIHAFSDVLPLLSTSVPFIIESIIDDQTLIEHELRMVRRLIAEPAHLFCIMQNTGPGTPANYTVSTSFTFAAVFSSIFAVCFFVNSSTSFWASLPSSSDTGFSLSLTI